MKSRIVVGVLALLAAQPALAGTIISPAKANGDFISGSGIPNGDFTVDTAATGESVALRARSRDTGYSLSTVGNKYYVPAGLASVVPPAGSPAWAFDYQFSPGTNGLPASSYVLTLTVDFDPAVGNALTGSNSETITGLASLSPDLHLNPGGGTWDTNAVPYVVANSLHLGFNFWNLPPFGNHPAYPYDPNTSGEYEIDFSVSDLAGNTIAHSQIFAEVTSVPAPPAIVLLGSGVVCGGLGQVLRRLRRR